MAELVGDSRTRFSARRESPPLQPDAEGGSIPHRGSLEVLGDRKSRRTGLRDTAGAVGDPYALGGGFQFREPG